MNEYILQAEATSIPVLPKGQRVKFRNIDEAFEAGWKTCQEYIATCIEPADVEERKTAQWIPSDIPDSILDKCSECGFDLGANTYRYCPMCGAKMVKLIKVEEPEAAADYIDRAVRQMLNNQLIIMGALDDLIMHGGGNLWAKVHPALTALHDGMDSTSAILAQSAEPPKEAT